MSGFCDLGVGVAALVVATLCAACAGEEGLLPIPEDEAAGGGGGGGAPSAPSMAQCAPGQRPLSNGACEPAGIGPGGCGEGFASDDGGGCEPLLPAEPCPKGTLALPGDEECQPVGACGAGTWGDIPVEGDTVFVDASYAGSDADGSAEHPFARIVDGIAAAPENGMVAVAAGTYAELVHLYKPVRVWGRCPELVEIVGSSLAVAAGYDGANGAADGSELHGVGVTSNEHGLIISGARDVVLDEVWFHDLGGAGIIGGDLWGELSFRATRILIEGAKGIGATAIAGEAELRDIVIRDTGPGPLGDGRGFDVGDAGAQPLVVRMERALIERNQTLGVYVAGGQVSLDRIVVRDIQPDEAGHYGRGLEAHPLGDSIPQVSLRRSVISNVHDEGILLSGAEGEVIATVVRDVQPEAATGNFGTAIQVQYEPEGQIRASVTLSSVLVERAYVVGLGVVSADADVSGLLLRDIAPRASDGTFGMGMVVSFDTRLEVTESPSASATVRWSALERSHVAGIAAVGSELTLEGVRVEQVGPTPDGSFGDGLLLLGGPVSARALVVDSALSQGARAGIANFGGEVSLTRTEVACNVFDLNGEPVADVPFTFEDGGNNRCGCPSSSEPCRVRSADLEPPAPP